LVAAHDARGFRPYERVIECGLLSGLNVRRFQKPRADMVISGSGPNLEAELEARGLALVFLTRIFSIVAPIQVIGFSHSPFGTVAGGSRPAGQAVASAGSR
jgi:hypothetical protein